MSGGPRSLRALPAYLGGKRRLCPALSALLGHGIQRERWRGMTFSVIEQAVSAVASQLDGKNRRGRALAEVARTYLAGRGGSQK